MGSEPVNENPMANAVEHGRPWAGRTVVRAKPHLPGSGIMAVLLTCGVAMELLTQFIDIILHLDVHLAALTAQYGT